MQRSVTAFDPTTGAHLAVLTSTIQPNLIQLSDGDMIAISRQELVRLNSLTQAEADTARYEVRED